MWVYKTGRSEEKKMVLYQFENDRKYDRASDYLEGFNDASIISCNSP